MKVDVKFFKGGKVKKIDARLAKALVGMGRVEYYDGQDVQVKKVLKAKDAPKKLPGRPKKIKEDVDGKPVTDNTYQTKVLTAEE